MSLFLECTCFINKLYRQYYVVAKKLLYNFKILKFVICFIYKLINLTEWFIKLKIYDNLIYIIFKNINTINIII